MQKPKKWYDVYPYGTKEGDEEAKLFRSLSRNAKFDYRSTTALIKSTGLTRERIEEIIEKYTSCSPPLIFPHQTNEEHWGYWERCEDRLQKDDRSVSKKDKDGRIDKHIGGMDVTGNVPSGSSCNGCDSCADKIVHAVPNLNANGDVFPPIDINAHLAQIANNDSQGELTICHKEPGFVIFDHDVDVLLTMVGP